VRPRNDFPKGREETAMLTKSLDYVGNIYLFRNKSKNTFRNLTLLIGRKTNIRSIEKSAIFEQEWQRMQNGKILIAMKQIYELAREWGCLW
jgi:hypothetical protein